MLPPGFISSSLAMTSASGSGKSRRSATIGVLPTQSSTESAASPSWAAAVVTEYLDVSGILVRVVLPYSFAHGWVTMRPHFVFTEKPPKVDLTFELAEESASTPCLTHTRHP